MQLHYDPVILPFVASLIITAGLAFYAAKKKSAAAKAFVMLMTALSIQTVCYVVGLSCVTLEAKILWLKLKYLGSAPAPIAWFVFALRTTNKDSWLKKPFVAFLVGHILLTWLIVLTNDQHHLMWKEIFLIPGIPEEQATHGPFFAVYAGSTYVYTLISVGLYFNYYRTTPGFFRKQALLLIIGGFLPAGSHMAEAILRIDFIPQVDEVIFVFLLSGICFALALFRYSALNIVHIAHNLVTQNISAGIVVLDVTGRVVDLNPYAQEILGTTQLQAVGKTIKDAPGAWRNLEIDGGTETEICVGRRGQKSYFFVQSSEIREGDGTLAGHAIVVFDITARKKAELQLELLAETLRESRDQIAAQAEQLAIQNEYLKENVRLREEVERISRHDLKTPLNSIIAVPRLLREQRELNENDDALITMVERAGYRALSMVNLSLDLFKIEQGTYRCRPAAVDLVDLLQKVAADIRSHADSKRVALQVITSSPRVFAWAEELLCYSITANLLKNAVEASPEGGVITIRINDGEKVTLCIHNDGAVPSEIRESFFEKYATSGKAGGTGLGTYSARLMARTQGGEIEMQSSDESGTTLVLKLVPAPASEVLSLAGHSDVNRNQSTSSVSELPRLRVLVVDDDEYNLLVMRRYLPSPPLEVETAVNGRSALDRAAVNHFDVILMDIEMPVMNGLDATRQIRALNSLTGHSPIIIGLSSHDDEETVHRCLEAGCNLYLRKPVSKEELRRTLAGVAQTDETSRNLPSSTRDDGESSSTRIERGNGITADHPIVLDEDLRDSLPSFIKSRLEAIAGMLKAVEDGDRDCLRKLAHRLAGSFTLYGFEWAGAHCRMIEVEAATLSAETIETHLLKLKRHLEDVRIDFAETRAEILK